ncbi:isoflavone reductase-like [Glycine soja]|uniref:isoflavone reductase-like n=1 Tax=Glycine soja TaxID=3848 RepID=UPI00103A0898|nr:isoflavone reductase-like [Glycine soja]XP_028221393.1 isoflavone reductase-like [Glycine soja]
MDFTAEKKESESNTENAHPTTLDSSSQLASALDSNNKEIEERQARELKAGIHPLKIDITVPPRDKVFILGDGNVKEAFVTEADVGTLTIEAANEPNALNKTVRIRLPKNYLTINEIISLWENKIGKTLEKTYVLEEKVLKDIKGKARFRG